MYRATRDTRRERLSSEPRYRGWRRCRRLCARRRPSRFDVGVGVIRHVALRGDPDTAVRGFSAWRHCGPEIQWVRAWRCGTGIIDDDGLAIHGVVGTAGLRKCGVVGLLSSRFMVYGSRVTIRGPRPMRYGLRPAAHSPRFTLRGLRSTGCGSRLMVHRSRLRKEACPWRG